MDRFDDIGESFNVTVTRQTHPEIPEASTREFQEGRTVRKAHAMAKAPIVARDVIRIDPFG